MCACARLGSYYDDRDPKIRKRAVAALEPASGPDVVRALLRAAADPDRSVARAAERLLMRAWPGVDEREALAAFAAAPKRALPGRLMATRALGECAEPGVAPLLAVLGVRDPEVRAAAVHALAAAGAPVALPRLHERLADREPVVRAAACAAIAVLRPEDAADVAIAVLAGDRAATPRVEALLTLAEHPRPAAADHIVRTLYDERWSVRVAAARALGEQTEEPAAARVAAEALVRALERERRQRVAFEISDALFLLTGIDFGPEPDRWTAWWKEAGRALLPPAKRPRRGGHSGGTGADLLDLPLESDHVVFVLDTSHSMNDPLRLGDPTSKKDVLVTALRRALSRLPKGARMNVIAFGTEVRQMKTRPFKATSGGRKAAVKFLDRLNPSGRTNIYDALTTAFDESAADTIVLVTDGAPSEGARTTRTGILDGIAAENRHRLARIHTVEIGSKTTGKRWRGFMADIAAATGGHHLAR